MILCDYPITIQRLADGQFLVHGKTEQPIALPHMAALVAYLAEFYAPPPLDLRQPRSWA